MGVAMRTIRFLVGAFCGGVVGALAVLCLAPMAGKDLRVLIMAELNHLVSDAQQAAADKQTELNSIFGRDL